MGPKVLLVDDDEGTRGAIARLLSSEGFTVEACEDGHQALARLRSATYDVLLADMVMPGPSGLELARAARGLSAGIRCVVMSGHQPPADVDGVTWLMKPLDIDELLAQLG